MAKVIANARGYYGGIIREPGDVFNAEWEASWFDPVGKAEPAAAEPEAPAADQATAKKGGRKKAETVEAPTAEPFADPPEPVRVANEANDITGQTQPDWVQG